MSKCWMTRDPHFYANGIINVLSTSQLGGTISKGASGISNDNGVSNESGTINSLGYNLSSDDGGGFTFDCYPATTSIPIRC